MTIQQDGRNWEVITVKEARDREGLVWWRPRGTETGKPPADTDVAYVPQEQQ